VDLAIDSADAQARISCPALVAWGQRGRIAALYDVPALWRARCAGELQTAAVPGGHFFVDESPAQTTRLLADFLAGSPA
jgi:haloacetate dehalogenase